MRISAKGRYGIAVIIALAQHRSTEEYTPVINISEELDISKIYLEQVFSLLKRADLVESTKGSQGGYRLIKDPDQINIYEVLTSIETALFEKSKSTVADSAPDMEASINEIIYDALDSHVKRKLSSITVQDLMNDIDRRRSEDSFMFYI